MSELESELDATTRSAKLSEEQLHFLKQCQTRQKARKRAPAGMEVASRFIQARASRLRLTQQVGRKSQGPARVIQVSSAGIRTCIWRRPLQTITNGWQSSFPAWNFSSRSSTGCYRQEPVWTGSSAACCWPCLSLLERIWRTWVRPRRPPV